MQNFLLPNDIESHHVDDHGSMRLVLTSVHDNSPAMLFISDKDESKIITDDIDLAGDLIHSLVTFLNIEDLRVSEFVESRPGGYRDCREYTGSVQRSANYDRNTFEQILAH